MSDKADKACATSLVEKVNANLEGFVKQQGIDREVAARTDKNLAIVKKVLLSDEMAKVLSARSIKEVASIDLDPIEYGEKQKKGKPKVTSGDDNASDVITPTVPRGGFSKMKVSKVTPKIAPPKVSTPKSSSQKVTKETDVPKEKMKPVTVTKTKGPSLDMESPEAKRSKRSVNFGSDDEMNEDDDEKKEEEAAEGDIGDPQPDINVILPQSNKLGRRVYGITGTNNSVIKGGSFLLYNVSNVYQFDERDVTAAKVTVMRDAGVQDMSDLLTTTSLTVDCAVKFVMELVSVEANNCNRPTYLERPIISMTDMDLKDLFNELPEPVRSGLHRYCKEVGLFKGIKEKSRMSKLLLMLDEIAQRVDSELAEIRLNLPAVTVDFEEFEHPSYVAPDK